MERKPFTLRLNPELYEALSSLSSVAHRSMNDLASEAVSNFVVAESRVVARDLEQTLSRLRKYTGRDPDFERAIEAFAEAEIRHDDPAEGTPVTAGSEVRKEVQALLDHA